MNTLKPVNVEYIRRFSILILLALFAWMFFYVSSDIYEIKLKDYAQSYKDKIRWGWVDSTTSLEQYIAKELSSPSWSSAAKKVNIVEAQGEVADFLKRIAAENIGELRDDFMRKHHTDSVTGGNNYFFREDEIPKKLTSELFLKGVDALSVVDSGGRKHYFTLYQAQRNFSLSYAPTSIRYPLEYYSYFLLVFALLIYILLPKPTVPEGAAYYTRISAVYMPDVLSVFLWTGAWMFFFLPDDSAPMFVRYFMLLFFGIFALAIVFPRIAYASNWYLFTEKSFRWSGSGGIQSVALTDIVSIKPYKRQLPKWVGFLIILFGRGQPGATGMGILAGTSAPEIGMEITTKSGTKIKVMANALESDKEFTKSFQELEKKVEGK
ncbi:MAG: hypothetical protein U9O64_08520 [Campylobacterota bacterium]|nr:hypothetical protein [Campylobacterota bacterium]